MDSFPLTIQDIHNARERIASFIRRTPLQNFGDLGLGREVQTRLKLENLQLTGSFKIRGAMNKMLCLSDMERKCGVVTVSSGNHGRAVSYAAHQLGIHATICLPETVPQNKVKVIQNLGAEIIVRGKTYDEADAFAHLLEVEKDLTFIHPFDDPAVIAGQGTIGLEILEEFPEIETVIVPLSGGGLLSGIALALKSHNPKIQVVGVSMERGPAMIESLKRGKVIEIVEEPTLADALLGGIGKDNRLTFRMVQELMDDSILVSESEITYAMAYALERFRLVIEGGGAVGLAAILAHKLKRHARRIGIVISGGNVDIPLLFELYKEKIPSLQCDRNLSIS